MGDPLNFERSTFSAKVAKRDEDEDLEKELRRFEIGLESLWAENPDLLDETEVERMKYLLRSESLADTLFLVGDEKVKIKGHRLILQNKSEFFSTLFSDRWSKTSGNEGIEIPGVESDDFLAFLEFLYAGETSIRADNSLPLLYLARMYGINDLTLKTVGFLKAHMTERIVIPVYNSLAMFEDKDAKTLTDAALKYISKNAQKIFNRDEFLDLKKEDLAKIMNQEIHHTDESQVFSTCLNWAKRQCENSIVDPNQENLRKALGEILKKIRFPLMSFNDFYNHVVQNEILEDLEKESISSYLRTPFNHRSSLMMVSQYFNIRPRKSTEFSMRRFESFKTTENSWKYAHGNKKADRVSFKINTPIILHGVGLFGSGELKDCDSVFCDYQVSLNIYAHERYESMLRQMKCTSKDGNDYKNGRQFKICLKQPLSCCAGIWYTIAIVCEGDRSYHGYNGKQTVTVACQNFPVTFEFKEAIDKKGSEFTCNKPLSNGSGVNIGQIPILYFSIDDEHEVELVDL